MRVLGAIVVLLVISAGYAAYAQEEQDVAKDYEAEASSLLNRLADTLSPPGEIVKEGSATVNQVDTNWNVSISDNDSGYFIVSHQQYQRAVSEMTLPNPLPRDLVLEPDTRVTVILWMNAFLARLRYHDHQLDFNPVFPDSLRELSKILDRNSKAAIENEQINYADFDKVQQSGKDLAENCPEGKPECKALKLALSPARATTMTIASPSNEDQNSHCASYQEPSYAQVDYSCQVKQVLIPTMVTDHVGAAQAGSHLPFIHLGGYSGEIKRETELLSNYRLELPDLMSYRSVRLVLQSPSRVLSLAVNEQEVVLNGVSRQPICYQSDQGDCQLQLDELEGGVELRDLLASGTNHLVLMQQGPRQTTDGILLRLIPADAVTPDETSPCPANLAANCRFAENKVCLEQLNGVCTSYARSYSCYSLQANEPSMSCEREQCTGPDCPSSGSVVANSDVRDALAKLEALRQMAVYMDKDAYTVFSGESGTCRSKVAWGLGNCCKSSGDRTSTTNAVTLARLGVSQVIRGVSTLGSPHTHDVLFLSDNLSDYLGNLGDSVLGEVLSPSLSYYGLSVSASQGVLTFSFDPTSFAVAVALSVVASLLECDQHEQVMGAKLGADLCYQQREWCSKKTLFFCREKTKSFCCFNSRLAKEVNRQGIAQLAAQQRSLGCENGCSYNPYTEQNISTRGECRGLSHSELEQLDFSRIDLTNVIENFNPEVDSQNFERYVQDNIAGANAAINSTTSIVPQPTN